MSGIIALDLDGTTTADFYHIPAEVFSALQTYVDAGWHVFFITGRPVSTTTQALQACPFPFYLGAQNGSILLKMPQFEILHKWYLNADLLPEFIRFFARWKTGFVVYGGWENQDACYYYKEAFSPTQDERIRQRMERSIETWYPLSSWEDLSLDAFSSIKCFGEEKLLENLAKEFLETFPVSMPIIRDPILPDWHVGQATHNKASKGMAIRALRDSVLHCTGPTIAAGDDYNDASMLQEATLSIVMDTAPPPLKKLADIVAPSAKEKGIIQGLQDAMDRLQ